MSSPSLKRWWYPCGNSSKIINTERGNGTNSHISPCDSSCDANVLISIATVSICPSITPHLTSTVRSWPLHPCRSTYIIYLYQVILKLVFFCSLDSNYRGSSISTLAKREKKQWQDGTLPLTVGHDKWEAATMWNYGGNYEEYLKKRRVDRKRNEDEIKQNIE